MLMYVWTMLLLTLFMPQTQELSLLQAGKVLKTSVLIKAKIWAIDDETQEIKRGLIGCSGTYITPTHVLTAAHCFMMPTTEIWVRGYNEKSLEAKLIKVAPEHDLALLAITSKKPHAFAKVAKSVRLGEQVISVGSPIRLEFALSEGIVSVLNVVSKPFLSKYLIHTAMINGGSSGGGAFNKDGELLGVNTMTMGGMFGWAGISMAVSIEDIRGFLK